MAMVVRYVFRLNCREFTNLYIHLNRCECIDRKRNRHSRGSTFCGVFAKNTSKHFFYLGCWQVGLNYSHITKQKLKNKSKILTEQECHCISESRLG